MASRDGLLQRAGTLHGHDGTVWFVAWSNSGEMIASCGGDKTARVWAPSTSAKDGLKGSKLSETWQCVATLDNAHTRAVRSCEWSPCDKYLCTCSFDGTTCVWERTGSSFENVAVLEGHENEVKRVSWSSNGELIATCGRDKTVWVWEVGEGVASGEFDCIAICTGHSQDVKCVTWHPSEEAVYSTSYDDTIRIWEARSTDDDNWECSQTLTKHESTVWDIAFETNTGGRFVSCSADETIIVWEQAAAAAKPAQATATASGSQTRIWQPKTTLKGHHSRPIYSVSWSKDHGCIASGSGDNAICIFSDKVAAPPGSGSASAEKRFEFQRCARVAQAHTSDVNCVAWNPTQPHLLASAGDDGLVHVWSWSPATP